MPLTFILLSTFVALAIYGLRRLLINAGPRKGLRYPPSPPGLPILGNMQRIPGPAWETYRKWSEEYGASITSLMCYEPTFTFFTVEQGLI